jgi:hypothetical protein
MRKIDGIAEEDANSEGGGKEGRITEDEVQTSERAGRSVRKAQTPRRTIAIDKCEAF